MKPNIPRVVRLPKRTVLTITSVGSPINAGPYISALYGAAYTTKFKVFKPRKKLMPIGACSAFWPDAHLKPKSQWTGIWNVEVPAFVTTKDVIQKNPDLKVKLGRLPGGLFAEVLFVGLYAHEGPTIKKLHAFMADQKLKIVGPHEEVYLTKPGPKAKTIIRYRVSQQKK